jgi:large subunit ribosomal protein L37Ae
MAKKGLGSVKRFGARYGRTVKHKLAGIEKSLRGFQTCPYCHSKRAKRTAAGIWECRKCNAKFTGRAYTIS